MQSLEKFRSFQLSIQFHKKCLGARFPGYLRNQILRASSSISLNLGEGSSKPTIKDRLRFYHIALGSTRECQSALMLIPNADKELIHLADQLGAHLYGFSLLNPFLNLPTNKFFLNSNLVSSHSDKTYLSGDSPDLKKNNPASFDFHLKIKESSRTKRELSLSRNWISMNLLKTSFATATI